MGKIDRNELMRALAARLSSAVPRLNIMTDVHWTISGPLSPIGFFETLPSFMEEGSTLYVEGTEIEPDLVAFYKKHLQPKAVEVAPDILFPKPMVFHLIFTLELCERFKTLLINHQPKALFHHIEGYAPKDVIFNFHDAFSGTLRLSHRIPENVVKKVSETLSATYILEPTEPENREVLEKLLAAMGK